MRRRPQLGIGDVVKLSRKGIQFFRHQSRLHNATFVVLKFKGPSDDGNTFIECLASDSVIKHHRRYTFRRKHLWSTGYNAMNSTTTPSKSTTKPRTNTHKCRCEWESVLAFGCKCGGV